MTVRVAATGSFIGDVDQYVDRVLRDIAQRNAMVITTPDGRAVQVVNEPLADGGWVATHEDITERRRAEARITHLAHYDALTDLPNRALFHELLKRELDQIAPGRQLAVLYIDIDEFKSVNDSLGHMIGDELLKSVAASLRGCVREDLMVYGGEPQSRALQEGDTRRGGPGYIHRVSHEDGLPAVSVHVYSPRLDWVGQYRLDEDGVMQREVRPGRNELTEQLVADGALQNVLERF